MDVGGVTRRVAEFLQIPLQNGGTDTHWRGRELSPRSIAVGYGLNDLRTAWVETHATGAGPSWISESTDEIFVNVNS